MYECMHVCLNAFMRVSQQNGLNINRYTMIICIEYVYRGYEYYCLCWCVTGYCVCMNKRGNASLCVNQQHCQVEQCVHRDHTHMLCTVTIIIITMRECVDIFSVCASMLRVCVYEYEPEERSHSMVGDSRSYMCGVHRVCLHYVCDEEWMCMGLHACMCVCEGVEMCKT